MHENTYSSHLMVLCCYRNIEQTLGTLRATKNNSGVVKPKSVPFLTYPDLKKYDKATLEEQNEMVSSLFIHPACLVS